MRKISLVLILAFSLLLCGCGEQPLTVEDYEWELLSATVIDLDTNEYCELPSAKVRLIARNGMITMTDEITGEEYNGVYIIGNRNKDGYDYTVSIEGAAGHGTVANTTYADGSKIPTLPLAITKGRERFSLHFQPKNR